MSFLLCRQAQVKYKLYAVRTERDMSYVNDGSTKRESKEK